MLPHVGVPERALPPSDLGTCCVRNTNLELAGIRGIRCYTITLQLLTSDYCLQLAWPQQTACCGAVPDLWPPHSLDCTCTDLPEHTNTDCGFFLPPVPLISPRASRSSAPLPRHPFLAHVKQRKLSNEFHLKSEWCTMVLVMGKRRWVFVELVTKKAAEGFLLVNAHTYCDQVFPGVLTLALPPPSAGCFLHIASQ